MLASLHLYTKKTAIAMTSTKTFGTGVREHLSFLVMILTASELRTEVLPCAILLIAQMHPHIGTVVTLLVSIARTRQNMKHHKHTFAGTAHSSVAFMRSFLADLSQARLGSLYLVVRHAGLKRHLGPQRAVSVLQHSQLTADGESPMVKKTPSSDSHQ